MYMGGIFCLFITIVYGVLYLTLRLLWQIKKKSLWVDFQKWDQPTSGVC